MKKPKAEFVMPDISLLKTTELRLSKAQHLAFVNVVRERKEIYGHSSRDIAELTGYKYTTIEHFLRRVDNHPNKRQDGIKNSPTVARAIQFLYQIEPWEYLKNY